MRYCLVLFKMPESIKTCIEIGKFNIVSMELKLFLKFLTTIRDSPINPLPIIFSFTMLVIEYSERERGVIV